jgi:hypothetical protein
LIYKTFKLQFILFYILLKCWSKCRKLYLCFSYFFYFW